jgi:transcriptional activator SPT8
VESNAATPVAVAKSHLSKLDRNRVCPFPKNPANQSSRPTANGVSSNGVSGGDPSQGKTGDDNGDAAGSPDDSLFGDKDSLFGDDKDVGGAPSGAGFGDDEDDEFSRAIANEIQQQQDEDANGVGDTDMLDAGGPVQPLDAANETGEQGGTTQDASGPSNGDLGNTEAPLTNGLPHGEEGTGGSHAAGQKSPDPVPSSESTFLDASIDGTLRVWDRRQPNPIARIPPRNTPPWCMNACWSPDGNFIYAGRRNGTVDEYSLHKGLREPRRTFRFPAGSGPVSALQPMPSGKHLVW